MVNRKGEGVVVVVVVIVKKFDKFEKVAKFFGRGFLGEAAASSITTSSLVKRLGWLNMILFC